MFWQQSLTNSVTAHDIHIAIVVGETSGDRLGAGLIRELKAALPNARFSGIGGPKMAAQGFECCYQMERIGVIGLDGLQHKLLDILRIRKTLAKRWRANRPSVFIGIDAPDFNLTLENTLKKSGVCCVHYVSPTVWAWRGYRIRKIKRCISHMLTLFPFEAAFYQRHQIAVTCVGHPLADEISSPDQASARLRLELAFRQQFGQSKLPANAPLLALLPGSRGSEVKRLAAPMIAAARLLLKRYPQIRFVLPFARLEARETFYQYAGNVADLPLLTLDGHSRLALEAADLAVLSSGTASLEASLLQLPHVVVYKLSAPSYWLMRRLRRVEHYAMPNHLLPSPMVPELIQDAATPNNIANAVAAYLDAPPRMAAIKQAFAKIHASLQRNADKRAAEVVLQMIAAST